MKVSNSNEKHKLRLKLDSLRGEYRKLLERYATDSKHLTDFTSHEDKVIAYVNSLNKQKQILEEQLIVQQKNEDLRLSKCEEEYQKLGLIEQEKLNNVSLVHAKYSKLIRKQTIILKDYEEEYNQNVSTYEKVLEEKRKELKYEMEILEKYENQQKEMFSNFIASNPIDINAYEALQKKDKEIKEKIDKLIFLKKQLQEQIDERKS